MPAPFAIPASDFAILCRVITATARQAGLTPEDADDFSQWAHLRLLERNYAPVTAFSGRSSLSGYLRVVVERLLLDWRNSQYGKWRPSAWARRHGRTAIELDRLISRDGHPAAEAVAILGSRYGADAAALARLADTLPARPRRRAVTYEEMNEREAAALSPCDLVERAQQAAARRQVLHTLGHACRHLSASDRDLLRLRFERGLSVASIGRLWQVETKPLYRRLNRILAALRRELRDRIGDVSAVAAAIERAL